MKVLMETGGIAGTNCYVVADEVAKQCVLFDAPDHTVSRLMEQIKDNDWQLVGLWLTHGHFDHVADHKVVTDAFPGTPVLIHKLDEWKLQNPNTKFFPLPFTIPAGKADAYVEDGQTLSVGSLTCRVIHTPGHAPGHVMYYFESEKLLIGGDLIIGGATGRYDFPDSSYDDLKASVRKIMKLPPDTALLAGHGDVSTLGEEMASNYYVRQIIEEKQ
jgi:hydroxyacylglutathione hydrolase